MRHRSPLCLLVLAACLGRAAWPAAAAEAADPGDGSAPAAMSPTEAVLAGTAHAALRYRFEFVDQDGLAENARASTARLRLNYETARWHALSAFAEFDYVGELLFDEFNSGGGTSPDRTQYPVVADPPGADLNQLYADVHSGNWTTRLGRQRILLDDQRFVGGVGWRQNEQTFDAVSFAGRTPWRGDLFYAWVGNANRIFGDSVPAGDHRMNTHLLNLRLPLTAALRLTPYLYYIDDDDDPTFSTVTLGLRGEGNRETRLGEFAWLAEFARQTDAADAPVAVDADYWHVDITWSPRGNWPALGLGVASLGGDREIAGAAFRTPLATLHAFQGWADLFLTTPDAGVADAYASLRHDRGNWELHGVYHHFAAEDGDDVFGRELDVSIGRRFGRRYVVSVIAAWFDTASPDFADTTKVWLMATAAY